jgi:hypothetical protein
MSGPVATCPLFAAEIREIKKNGTAVDPWGTFEVPNTAHAGVRNGGTFYRISYPAPRCVPAKGHLTFYFMGDLVLRFCYGDGGSAIPTVRSATAAAEHGPTGRNPCRPTVEAESPGYTELPDEKWVQLNATTDRFTIQARLRKMPLEDSVCDSAAGVYYVYGVDTLVVHVNQRFMSAPPSSDNARALSI